jgi:hypothetical protein
MSNRISARFVLFLYMACWILAAGCGLFDSGTVWRHGQYALIWIDLPDEVSLSYDVGNGGWTEKVNPRVFAVGANERYIVAKQHPGGNKSITNYFIIDTKADSLLKPGVVGPLTERDFVNKSKDMTLPTFTKVLESLQ